MFICSFVHPLHVITAAAAVVLGKSILQKIVAQNHYLKQWYIQYICKQNVLHISFSNGDSVSYLHENAIDQVVF